MCGGCLESLLSRRIALPPVSGLDGPFDLDACPGCGTTYMHVSQGGLFGCPACYASFNRFAEAILASDSGIANRQETL